MVISDLGHYSQRIVSVSNSAFKTRKVNFRLGTESESKIDIHEEFSCSELESESVFES